MGTVHVTGSHHNLYVRHPEGVDLTRRVLLEKDVLARPILNVEQRPLAQESQRIIRAAFQGLMDLVGFDATVSFGLVKLDGLVHLIDPHRQWGEITLGSPENVIVGLSHDTRYGNTPFRRIWQWCEAAPSPDASEDDHAVFELEWAEPEKWVDFYETRIRSRYRSLRTEATDLRRKADEAEAKANAIRDVLV